MMRYERLLVLEAKTMYWPCLLVSDVVIVPA